MSSTWTEGAAVNPKLDLIDKDVARSLTASGERPDPEAVAEAWLESSEDGR